MAMTAVRRRTPWWLIVGMILAVGILGTLLMAVVHRDHGRRMYQAQVAARQAAGRPATVADVIAMGPPVDREIQEAWWTWSQSWLARPRDPTYDQSAWDHWLVAGGEPPASIVATVDKQRADIAPALALLRRGGLVLSGHGWAAIDLSPGRRNYASVSAIRLPNLMALRDLASWLGYSAVLDENPTQHLTDLEALLAAEAEPSTLIDAFINLASTRIRDRTYVDLAMHGTLPSAAGAAWQRVPPHLLQEVADGIDGERALFLGATGMSLDQAPIQFLGRNLIGADEGWRVAFLGLAVWTTGFEDLTHVAAFDDQLADRLRGTRTDAPSAATIAKAASRLIGAAIIPTVHECAITALEADSRSRMARLAVRLVELSRQQGLPADQSALVALLGPAEVTPAGDHLHLRYERLSPTRFRITIDPASPAPDFDEPGRMVLRGKAVGTPPSPEPVVWKTNWLIEVELPAKTR